jgi:hypothetical protein
MSADVSRKTYLRYDRRPSSFSSGAFRTTAMPLWPEDIIGPTLVTLCRFGQSLAIPLPHSQLIIVAVFKQRKI